MSVPALQRDPDDGAESAPRRVDAEAVAAALGALSGSAAPGSHRDALELLEELLEREGSAAVEDAARAIPRVRQSLNRLEQALGGLEGRVKSRLRW